MTFVFKKMKSPVGELTLIGSDQGLSAIVWEKDDPARVRLSTLTEENNHPILQETEKQLRDYFDGELKIFSIALHFIGTDFQKEVWNALLTIPFGETRSYAQIAKQIGNHRQFVLWARPMARILFLLLRPATV